MIEETNRINDESFYSDANFSTENAMQMQNRMRMNGKIYVQNAAKQKPSKKKIVKFVDEYG